MSASNSTERPSLAIKTTDLEKHHWSPYEPHTPTSEEDWRCPGSGNYGLHIAYTILADVTVCPVEGCYVRKDEVVKCRACGNFTLSRPPHYKSCSPYNRKIQMCQVAGRQKDKEAREKQAAEAKKNLGELMGQSLSQDNPFGDS